MREIFVTGATGFIGSKLVRILSEDKSLEISRLDRRINTLDDRKWLLKTLSDCDVVVHLGGLTRGDAKDLVKANVEGTIDILETISLIPHKKPILIFASTIGVYKEGTSLDEKSLVKPRSNYGLSKYLTENVIINYADRYKIPSIILRLANVYGPDMPAFSHSVVATFIELINTDSELVVNSTGSQKRDFVYVDDVVSAIYKAVKVKMTNPVEIVNICSASSTSINSLIKLISNISDKKAFVKYNEKVQDYNWVAKDYKKAKRVLKWIPSVSLAEGLKRIYEKKNWNNNS